MDLSSEPTVDTGLRATQRALSSLQRRMFAEQADISGQIDAMRATVQELDTVSGPIHRQVAAQSFQRSADAIKSMSQALNQRFSEGAAASKPEAAPTPAPAAATPPKPEQPATPTPAQPATPPQPEQPKTETPAQPKPEQPTPAPTPKPESGKPAQPAQPLPELNK
jgi:outer membrane biosynthesis protein TonB